MVIPIVGECDDSHLNDCRRMHVTADDVRARTPRRSPRAGSAAAAGRGRRRGRHRHVLPGLQGRHRHVVAGHRRGPHRRRPADDQLRLARPAPRRRRTGRAAAAARTVGAREARRLLHRHRGHRRSGRRARRAAAGPPGRARPGPGRVGRDARQRRDLPGLRHRAAARPRPGSRTGPRWAGVRSTRSSRPSSRPPRRRC